MIFYQQSQTKSLGQITLGWNTWPGVLTYERADSADQFFMDGAWNTFEFTEAGANLVSAWKSAVTMSNCDSNQALKYIKQSYNDEKYEFCYEPSWPITLESGNRVKITPPVQNNKQIQGEFSFDYNYTHVLDICTSTKNNSEYSNMVNFTTPNGYLGLEFDHVFFPKVMEGSDPSQKRAYHYIEIYNQNDTQYGRRGTLLFLGDTEGYDFSQFKNDVVSTFSFLEE